MQTRTTFKTPSRLTRSSVSNTPVRVTRSTANKTPTRAPKNKASKTPTRITPSRDAKNRVPSEVMLKSTQESITIARQDVGRKLQVSKAPMKDIVCSQKSSVNPKLSLGNPDGASSKSGVFIGTKKALTRPWKPPGSSTITSDVMLSHKKAYISGGSARYEDDNAPICAQM